MSYVALARRYRSQSFDALVGQEPIARTLANAVAADRVGHAYLFCGTRGVGKTTTARLFARELAGGSEEADAAIMAGRDTDVIEIDAASNRGIDEARELIASSVYRPLRGRRKVYIIDEVHMLTREAFNALLKTMEEPPDHVTFILCTTEAHKVPATIQSRCQRFDFRPIAAARIADHLAAVIATEGLEADPALVHAAARLGEGSMRDALSVLDRVIASGQKKLTLGLLEELLGLPPREGVSALIDAISAGDPGAAIARLGDLLAAGISEEQAIDALCDRLRDLLVLAACGPATDLVDLAEPARADEVARAGRFDPASLVHMIAVCDAVARQARSSSARRAIFEAAVARLAMTDRFADAAALARGAPVAVARAEPRATPPAEPLPKKR